MLVTDIVQSEGVSVESEEKSSEMNGMREEFEILK